MSFWLFLTKIPFSLEKDAHVLTTMLNFFKWKKSYAYIYCDSGYIIPGDFSTRCQSNGIPRVVMQLVSQLVLILIVLTQMVDVG